MKECLSLWEYSLHAMPTRREALYYSIDLPHYSILGSPREEEHAPWGSGGRLRRRVCRRVGKYEKHIYLVTVAVRRERAWRSLGRGWWKGKCASI